MLEFIISFNLICLFLFILPSKHIKNIKPIFFIIISFSIIFSTLILLFFQQEYQNYQFLNLYNWNLQINHSFITGIDGISIIFIILTIFLTNLCIITSWNSSLKDLQIFTIQFLILQTFSITLFSVIDIFVFYILFESTLIPIFLIIGYFGSRQKKIRAAYQLFLFTILGSLFILLAIVYLFIIKGTTNTIILSESGFTETEQILIWLAFFLAFAIKIPIIPIHIWLPEAHVEAPTTGSVFLAGIMLKIGTYGFIRFLIPIFPIGCLYSNPLIYLLSITALIYISLTTIRQIDFKKVIAYSSISHIALVTIGIFSFNQESFYGSLLLIYSHGLISSALFIILGFIYEKHKTRTIKYYSGLNQIIPIFSAFFIIFSIANIALPGTSSFVCEILILIGVFLNSKVIGIIATTGIVFSASYSLWLYNRIIFGNTKTFYIKKFTDLNFREFNTLISLFCITTFIALYPTPAILILISNTITIYL